MLTVGARRDIARERPPTSHAGPHRSHREALPSGHDRRTRACPCRRALPMIYRVSIAATKIQRPRLRAGVTMARPALERRLLQALDEQPLVVLVAPGGSGKTALLVRSLERLPEAHEAAWVALDAGGDLQRLLQCLWRALEPFDLPWRTSPEALATMASSVEAREQQRAADEIVNTLEQGELARGVIALDDLHHVDDPHALAFIDRVPGSKGAAPRRRRCGRRPWRTKRRATFSASPTSCAPDWPCTACNAATRPLRPHGCDRCWRRAPTARAARCSRFPRCANLPARRGTSCWAQTIRPC